MRALCLCTIAIWLFENLHISEVLVQSIRWPQSRSHLLHPCTSIPNNVKTERRLHVQVKLATWRTTFTVNKSIYISKIVWIMMSPYPSAWIQLPFAVLTFCGVLNAMSLTNQLHSKPCTGLLLSQKSMLSFQVILPATPLQ